jgi:phosphatidylglycerol:prolipoprotein diacylglycerol transferase
MIPFLHLGPLTIPTFGLMVACAMIAAFFTLRADLRRRGIVSPSLDDAAAETLVAFPCLAGIAGAKLYHVLETPLELWADPFGQIFSAYGFAWFGGLIGGALAFLFVARGIIRRSPRPAQLLEIFDAGSPAAALGYGIGRIGCFLSGDGDYGTPTSLPWAMSFPNGIVPTTERVHPTPIYELLAACLIAWWLWRLGARQIALSRPDSRGAKPSPSHEALAHPGFVFGAYLVLTGAARFLVEFIRINPRSFFGLSNAQAASLVSIFAGLSLLIHLRRK